MTSKVIIIKSMNIFWYHISRGKIPTKENKKLKKIQNYTLLAKHTQSVHLIGIYPYGLT